MLHTYLQELQKKSQINNKEIAERSGVPRSTVDRILSGETSSPQFQNVVDIVMVMDGSLDELVGIIRKQPDAVQLVDSVKVLEAIAEATKKAPQAGAQEAIRTYRKWIRALFICICVLVAFIMFMIILDALKTGAGWIRG